MTHATSISRTDQGLILTRRLPASTDTVFAALSNADDLMSWWGPPECPMVTCTLDFRPGGVWHYQLRCLRTGREIWARSVYREIDPPRRLRYFETASGPDGRITHDRPAADVTVGLEPDGSDTTLTVTIRYSSVLERDRALAMGIERGFSAALDLLVDLLRSRSHSRTD
ncbi:SRPBCC domain-containing protein [Lysobacter korlensis]|uniref:SRPBCC domain-containing protein n=1 Tax=Lysobacter korlensis TaxID=553636 RepID=A0ABV6RW47_9GAMM